MPAEQIVSPGVFTSEKDLSYLPQGIGEIGGAFIGSTVKGPAFVPTVVDSPADFDVVFGGEDESMYTPYSVKQYLKHAPSATVVRVLGLSGYKLTSPLAVVASGSFGLRTVSVLHPTYVITNDDDTALFEDSIVTDNTSGSFVLKISGSMTTDTSAFTGFATNKVGTEYSASIDPNSNDFIGDLFGYTPKGQEPVYNYAAFKNSMSASLAEDPSMAIIIQSGSASQEWDFTDEFSAASTPWITSQQIGGSASNLFKVHTISHGADTNYELKIGIQNIKPAGTVPGSEYGSFTLIVRAVDQDKIYGSPHDTTDSDSRPNIVESFAAVNLDPDSPNYIARVIGDKYVTVTSAGKTVTNGDYKNLSKYIRVEMHDAVKVGAYSPVLVPFGFRSLYSPIPTGFAAPASATFVAAQTIGGIYNKKAYFGFDYDFTNTDNLNYLKPTPDTAVLNTGSNSDFYLGDYNQHADAGFPSTAAAYSGSINLTTSQTSEFSRQFVVPFQGGSDGWKPNIQRRTAEHITTTNTQGFDLSSTGDGYTAYTRALNVIANPLQYDINMLVLPGVLHRLHSGVTVLAKNVCEERGDCFYPMDSTSLNDTVATAVSTVAAFDSSYAATYYPWVKILDAKKNKPVWVPPSVVIPGTIAFNDKVSYEWFAPAGLNRGGISEAIDVQTTLDRDDMNTLYPGRVNPIAVFPNDGITVWGQKTLQAKPSALDRINVRRLMIAAKKYIASTSRYLNFENNTASTRNRFLNIANPYFESVQQRQGLYAFRVVMDETNNTADVIDRNILYGQIFLQPAKAAEFVKLDFNIQPTGAEFPDA